VWHCRRPQRHCRRPQRLQSGRSCAPGADAPRAGRSTSSMRSGWCSCRMYAPRPPQQLFILFYFLFLFCIRCMPRRSLRRAGEALLTMPTCCLPAGSQRVQACDCFSTCCDASKANPKNWVTLFTCAFLRPMDVEQRMKTARHAYGCLRMAGTWKQSSCRRSKGLHPGRPS
jgi:hypothetical protein